MKRATVRIRVNPRHYGQEIAERTPYVEVPGWACEVVGEPCVVHRPLGKGEDGEPVEGDGGRHKLWTVSHLASGAKITGGMVNETREELVERANRFVEERGGRETLLRLAAELVEREGAIQ